MISCPDIMLRCDIGWLMNAFFFIINLREKEQMAQTETSFVNCQSLPAPGDGAPLIPLRESGVTGDENGMLRLLPLWGLENPLREGEWEPSSPTSPPLLFSGSSGGSPPRFRLSRPSTASSRLWSSLPFPSNNEDKSVLSVSLCNPRPPLRLFRALWGELWALGVLRERGGEGWWWYGEFWEFGIRSCHTGGGVELQRTKREG